MSRDYKFYRCRNCGGWHMATSIDPGIACPRCLCVRDWYTEISEEELERDLVRDADLSGQDLTEWDVSQKLFVNCNFRGANLRGATLFHCWFFGCDFADADLRDADLTGMHTYEFSDRTKVEIEDVVCDFTRADFRGAIVEWSTLSCCVMNEVQAEKLDLSKSRFRMVVSRGGNFRQTTFGTETDYVIFSRAILVGSNIHAVCGHYVYFSLREYGEALKSEFNFPCFHYLWPIARPSFATADRHKPRPPDPAPDAEDD